MSLSFFVELRRLERLVFTRAPGRSGACAGRRAFGERGSGGGDVCAVAGGDEGEEAARGVEGRVRVFVGEGRDRGGG